MTIEELVKNYFKKSYEEQLEIQSRVLTDIIEIMEGEHISYSSVDKHLKILIQKAIQKEDYEIAEIFTRMRESLKIFIQD